MREKDGFGSVPAWQWWSAGVIVVLGSLSFWFLDWTDIVPVTVAVVYSAVLAVLWRGDRRMLPTVPPAVGELARYSVPARFGLGLMPGAILFGGVIRVFPDRPWLGGGLLLVTVLLLWGARPRRGLFVSADAQGLTVLHAGRRHLAPWSQVHHLGPAISGGWLTAPGWRVRVAPWPSADHKALLAVVGAHVRTAQFAATLSRAAQEELPFGEVTLRPDGLRMNGSLVPWSEIVGVGRNERGFVEVTRLSGRRTPLAKVNDEELFLAVVGSRLLEVRPGPYRNPSYPQPTFGVPTQATPVDLTKPADSAF